MEKKWKTFFGLWAIVVTVNFGLLNQYAGGVSTLPTVSRELIAICNDTRVRMRSSPSASGETIDHLDLGDRLKVIEKASSAATISGVTDYFYKVARDGDTHAGWVFGAYLITKETSWLNKGWPTLPDGFKLRVVNVVQGDSLNMRARPDAGSTVVGKIPRDAGGIEYLGMRDGSGDEIWLRVSSRGSEGWVSSQFVESDTVRKLSAQPDNPLPSTGGNENRTTAELSAEAIESANNEVFKGAIEAMDKEVVKAELIDFDSLLEADASSTYSGDLSYDYSPAMVLEGDAHRGVWVEGASGYGVGEWIRLAFKPGSAGMYITKKVRIGIGFNATSAKGTDLWNGNSRPSDLLVEMSNGVNLSITLQDIPDIQEFDLDSGTPVDWVRFTIKGVYRGANDHTFDVCIALIDLKGVAGP